MSIEDEVEKLLKTPRPIFDRTNCPMPGCNAEAVQMHNGKCSEDCNHIMWCCDGHVTVMGNGFESVMLITEGR